MMALLITGGGSWGHSLTGSKSGRTPHLGTMNADVLQHFAPDFHRIDFVDVIKNSARPE